MLLARKPIQDISVIDLTGDIYFREMIRIKDAIGSLIEKERIKVVLNLKSVDHINYLSIGVLLERLKLLRNLNGDLKLAGMSPFLRDIFKVVGMDRFFEDYTSLEDAIESFDDDWEGDGTSHLGVSAPVSVLVREVIECLRPGPGKRYFDGTVGGGGHAEQILIESSPDGQVLALDRDDTALGETQKRLGRFEGRVITRQASFAEAKDILTEIGWNG